MLSLVLTRNTLLAANTVISDACQSTGNTVTIEPNAEAMILGLFDMRGPLKDGVGCGQPDMVTMPAYEAVKWMLKRLNQDSGQIDGQSVTDSYVPGVKIGMKVTDTCGNSKVAIEKLITGYQNYYVPARFCNDESKLKLGTMGASRSVVSQELAMWLATVQGAQVSFSSASTSLGDRTKYPFFMRTVPPNSVQAQVVLEILKKLGWTKISVVYSDDRATKEDYESILRVAVRNGICITQAVSARRGMTSTEKARILTKIKESDSNGVLYVGYREELFEVLSSIQNVQGSNELQWILTGSISPDDDLVKQYAIRLRGMIAVAPESRLNTEFRNYWTNLNEVADIADNPWFKEWFMTVNDCKLAGITYEPYSSKTSCPPPRTTQDKQSAYVQNQYVASAIDAVLTFAQALKQAHTVECGGARGVCQQLQTMTTEKFFNDYLLKVQLTYSSTHRAGSTWTQNTARSLDFDPSGELMTLAYDIWNYNDKSGSYKVTKVGSYRNRQLTMDTADAMMYNAARSTALQQLPQYSCPPSGCGMCLDVKDPEVYVEMQGDLLINTVQSVHDNRAGRCGDISARDAQHIQAFIYAVKNVKTKLNILPNVDLGAIGFDDCGLESRASTFIQQLQSGLVDIRSVGGDPYTPQDSPAFVAASQDDTTLVVAEHLTRLKIAQISALATTSKLSNLKQYPYFMRTIPSNGKLANAMVQIMKEMDWLYVQVVNSPDTHGRTGSQDFMRQAGANGICVTAAYEFSTHGTADEIVAKLRERVDAKVVAVFAPAAHHAELLKAVKDSGAAGNILLVGDANWGSDTTVTQGNEDAARGSITIDLETSSLNEFQQYLTDLDVNKHTTNPWFRDWYQKVFSCYLDAKSMPMYTVPCDPTRAITSAPGFATDSHTLHVINAVYTSALGIHNALEKVCGVGYNRVCDQFKQYPNRGNLVVEEMERALFTDPASKTFQLDRREGNVNFDIYNYRAGGPQKIGTFTTKTAQLQLNKNQIQYHSTPITSVCSGGKVCNICLQKLNKVLFIPGDVYLAGLFDIHWTGDSVYTCGDVKRMNGYQKSEVFAYAIDQINNGQAPVKLNGVKLGGVGFDDCSSGFQAASLISSIYSGATTVGKDGETVQPEMLKVWISYGSQKTVAVAEELTKRQVPLISPDASSTELSDADKYPTFFRTIPTDHFTTQSMIRLFQALNWGCVQIVYSPNVYGRTGYQTFRRNAKDAKLCVTQCLELETHGTYDELMAKIKDAPSKAVVVIAEGDYYIPKLLEAKQKANVNDVVFIGASSWGNSKNVVKGFETAARKSLVIKAESPIVQGFNSYLQNKYPGQYTRNPWFETYYQTLFACDLPGQTRYNKQCTSPQSTPLNSSPDYEQESWVVTTMDAVYAAAQAIHMTLKEKCGDDYAGLCPEFVANDVTSDIIGNLGKVNFESVRGKEFKFNSRSGGVGFDIYRYTNQDNYEKVGTTIGLAPQLTDDKALRDEYTSTPTTCTPCDECKLDIELNTEEKFLYIPGDILLGGMFDVSKRGLFPFTCDMVRPQYSFQLVEAFAYAIEQVNNKQGIFSDKLRSITLGGVALDSCESAIRAGNLISDFHSGVITLSKNGDTVDPKKIKAYIGGMNTQRSMQMADVLNEIDLPQVSYAAAGMGLSDVEAYPMFSRTIPANKKQVKGIIEFLKRYNINSVQLINSPGAYGEDGANEFMKVAEMEKVCVSQNITFKDNGTVTVQSATEVVNLLLNRPNSTVVVTFLETDYINQFLRSIVHNKKANNKFRFVGSQAWGKNTAVYKGAESQIQNTIAFNVDTGNVPGFNEYLASKSPNTYIRNPWFSNFFQEIYQCTLPGSSLPYQKPCTEIDRSVVNDNYEQEAYVMYVVEAVYTAAIGLDTTLRDICGHNYTGICDEWSSSMNPKTHLLKGIRHANFTDPANGQEFKFIDDGESIRGFEIYSLERYSAPGSVLEYNLIGKYAHKTDTELELIIAPSYRFGHLSNCSYEESCDMCPYMNEKLTRYMKVPSSEDINVVGFFGVHYMGDNYMNCGTLDSEEGFLNTLAFFYGLSLVNQNSENDLHANVKIGGLAIDTCKSINKMRIELYSFLGNDGLCKDADRSELFPPETVVAYLTGDSHSSLVAGGLLTPLQITSMSQSMVQPANTSADYPYLLRELPNCGKLGGAVYDILLKYEWSFFLAVYTDDECGHAALDHLNLKASEGGYCLGKSHMMTESADVKRAEAIVKDMNGVSNGKVLVLLTNEEHTRLILEAIKNLDLAGRFIIIGLDSWGDDENVVEDLEEVAAGSITLKLPKYPLPGFAKWVASMTDQNRLGVPEDWFHEFWQHTHKCHIRNAKVSEIQYAKPCRMDEMITEDMIEDSEQFLYTTISSYVIAKGMTRAQNNPRCAGLALDECLAVNPNTKRELIFEAIKAVTFQVFPETLGNNQSFELEFDTDNDAKSSYEIYNYIRDGDKYAYKMVGRCSGDCEITGVVIHYDEDGQPRDSLPKSQCPTDGSACVCETKAEERNIRPAPGIADQFTEVFGIIIIVLNILGMFLSFILFFHFICFYPNRGGTTVLGYLALFGVFILFAFNFSYVVYPHYIVCAVRRFFQGVVYALIFGALGVKSMCTWKNTNIYDDFEVVSGKRYTHPCGLVIITFCFMAVQIMIAAQWLILEPPMAEYIIYDNQYWPRCSPHEFFNQGLVLSLLYVMFLMFLTLGFSGFSWPNVESHYEARYILGSTVFCMGTWMVWCIVSTMTDVKYRDGAIALGNIFCGFGLLFFIFFRKCFLLQKYRRQKYSRKLDDEKKGNVYDNIAVEKDDDQMSDKSSGHGSL